MVRRKPKNCVAELVLMPLSRLVLANAACLRSTSLSKLPSLPSDRRALGAGMVTLPRGWPLPSWCASCSPPLSAVWAVKPPLLSAQLALCAQPIDASPEGDPRGTVSGEGCCCKSAADSTRNCLWRWCRWRDIGPAALSRRSTPRSCCDALWVAAGSLKRRPWTSVRRLSRVVWAPADERLEYEAV